MTKRIRQPEAPWRKVVKVEEVRAHGAIPCIQETLECGHRWSVNLTGYTAGFWNGGRVGPPKNYKPAKKRRCNACRWAEAFGTAK